MNQGDPTPEPTNREVLAEIADLKTTVKLIWGEIYHLKRTASFWGAFSSALVLVVSRFTGCV